MADDIQLDSGSKYLVLSGIDNGVGENIAVNYLGNGRFDFTTSAESNSLYLTTTQDENRTLIWDGTAEAATWNQQTSNKNWNTADEMPVDISFMNRDTVSFTDAAANKNVTVAEAGVHVA